MNAPVGWYQGATFYRFSPLEKCGTYPGAERYANGTVVSPCCPGRKLTYAESVSIVEEMYVPWLRPNTSNQLVAKIDSKETVELSNVLEQSDPVFVIERSRNCYGPSTGMATT
ncbi:hypothetical protein GCM10027402_22200 [Arthrobacter monumenti]